MRPSPAPNGKCHERMTWQQPSHRANCTPAPDHVRDKLQPGPIAAANPLPPTDTSHNPLRPAATNAAAIMDPRIKSMDQVDQVWATMGPGLPHGSCPWARPTGRSLDQRLPPVAAALAGSRGRDLTTNWPAWWP
jgi:hypothetical protein